MSNIIYSFLNCYIHVPPTPKNNNDNNNNCKNSDNNNDKKKNLGCLICIFRQDV